MGDAGIGLGNEREEEPVSGRIVVGVDGSDESVAALEWAAQEARSRGAVLTIVTAWQFPHSAYLGLPGAMIPDELGEDLEWGAKETQADALHRALPSGAGVPVETLVVEGPPASVLIDAASGADMLVVGSRGLGGFRELLLGSVSQQCAHHASCPVVIVRAREPVAA